MAATTLPAPPQAGDQTSVAPATPSAPEEPWYSSLAGVFVAGLGMLVLLAIVGIALATLPPDSKGQNVTALATSGFGVIGAIVGAYFGIRSANRAVDKAHKK